MCNPEHNYSALLLLRDASQSSLGWRCLLSQGLEGQDASRVAAARAGRVTGASVSVFGVYSKQQQQKKDSPAKQTE